MTDFQCVNCGSDNLENLGNDEMITSQGVYQDLLQLKQLKEKKLERTTYARIIEKLQKNIKKTVKRYQNILKDFFKDLDGCFVFFLLLLIGSFYIKFLSSLGFEVFVKNIYYSIFSVMCTLIFSILFWHILILAIYFIKLPLDFLINTIKICQIKIEIKEMNQQLIKFSNLYYCHHCNYVMDLETKLYKSPEQINKLLYQLDT